MEFRHECYILKAFLAAGLLSLMMMVLAMGLIQLFRYGPSLPISIILILAAVTFVLSASFSSDTRLARSCGQCWCR